MGQRKKTFSISILRRRARDCLRLVEGHREEMRFRRENTADLMMLRQATMQYQGCPLLRLRETLHKFLPRALIGQSCRWRGRLRCGNRVWRLRGALRST